MKKVYNYKEYIPMVYSVLGVSCSTSSARLFAPFLPPPGEPNFFFIVATVSIDVNDVRSCLNFVFKLILHDCGSVHWVQCPHVLDKVL